MPGAKVPFPTIIKLASIAVHAEELLSPGGHTLDREAILGLLADADVQAFLRDPDMRVFLPIKRS